MWHFFSMDAQKARKRAATDHGGGKRKRPKRAASRAKEVPGTDRPRLLYRIAEVAKLFGCDPHTVYDLCGAGKLRYVRLAGGTMRIPAAAIDAYLSGDAAWN
jgi:excisionase family DNA binding protein